jgi:Uma2 family endonuclease
MLYYEQDKYPERKPVMTTEQQLYTIQDVLALPDDAHRYELVQEELRRMSPAGRKHGRLIMNMRAPDIAFVRQERLAALPDADGFFAGPPDLAVEFISPNDL